MAAVEQNNVLCIIYVYFATSQESVKLRNSLNMQRPDFSESKINSVGMSAYK
jgi:hypothetical protein